MKKFSKYLLMSLLTIASIVLVFNLVIAQEDNGKIVLTKTATKIYEGSSEKNLEYGRLAEVSLKVNANPYTENTTTNGKLDIVIVFDGSGSMAWGPKGQYEEHGHTVTDWSTPSRLDSAKSSATDFANTLMDETGNVQIGIVEFGNDVKDVQNLTSNKSTVTNFISTKLDADGGTNLQAGIARANDLLASGREDAKKIVIILTDGIPTFFNYTNSYNQTKRAGTGNSNDSQNIRECTKFEEIEYRGNKYTVCTESQNVSRTPSQAAKNELDSLKATYTTADVYTITFGEEAEAATILAEVNPEQANPLYKNYTALTGEELKGKFEEIIEQTKNIIGKNSVATDIIPKEFTLTDDSKSDLEAKGIVVTENEDGTTTLTWNIGNIEANKELEISYIICAKDEYHGSMYTNESAKLTTTVEESNPAYSSTSLNLSFDKEQPTVEIPAIANDDHYSNNESYIAYGEEQITGTSILTNDLNKNILKDNENDDLTDIFDNTAKVEDIIVVNENVNTVKVENTENTYKIYKDGTLQGTLVINSDGTFTFKAEENITGEVTFSYHIDSTIDPMKETSIVHSNDAIVTILINERKTLDITGTKTWNDNNDQDGKRPESIKVNLLANGEVIETKTVTANENWKYEFNDLYKYELGYENNKEYEIDYSIEEIKVDGYTTKVNGYDITNTHEPEVTEISGTKTWNDNKDQDGKRPESITVNLLANGKVAETKTVTAKDTWEYSFKNLPVYESGKKITYTITESEVEGYTTEVNGYDITNTHTPEVTEISGIKTWNDNNNQDGKRPESITVNLLANGKVVETKTVTAKETWEYSFKNLPVYESGKKITYTITESEVEGYTTEINGYDITNTHIPETTEISGIKTWEDNNNQDGKRPESITVNLLANGKVIETKTVTETDGWKYSFTNMPVYENGKKITYTITESEVEGYTASIDGYNITNSYTPEVTEIKGNKTWEDNNNQDGKRPESITVNLLANGEVVDTKTVTETDGWKYSFTNIPVYENGKEITYTITENTVEGYTTEVNGYNITNTHTPEVKEISGTKTWEDNNNQDGKRPESITVNLIANGKVVSSKNVTEADGWKYTFINIPVYENGKEITYTITENTVEGYNTSIDGYNITNSYTPEVTEIKGNKTWEDNNNQDGKRPTSITVNLLANEKVVETKTVTEADGWKYSFTNMPVYENGKKITYTVTENEVDGYTTEVNGYNITNTHTPETTKVVGQKIWKDNNNQDGMRPASITVRLYADGTEVNYGTFTAGTNNDWTYAFENLPKYNNGKEIVYTVKEDAVEEYETSYDETNPYIIINTHQTKTIDVTGEKTWDDNNNQDGKRPESITVNLLANGEIVETKTVIEKDNWKYSFTNLDMYKEGKLITYTITENAVEGYSTTIDNYNITNAHTPETITIDGTKTWDDNDDQDGKRPESITINLLANGEIIDSKIVSAEDDWTYEFKDFDKYANGEEIVYTVTEEIVEGYETIVDGYNVTNNHEIEKITFKTTKIWDDNDNQDGMRPEEIIVELYKNAELVETVTINEENNWTYTFENLDRYENGREIIYTVKEFVVEGYSTTIDYSTIDENNIVSATITNTHTPETITINGTKTWNDYDNIEQIRPEEIKVDLYANGEFLQTIIISSKDEWKYIVEELPKYNSGEEIKYTIEEQPVDRYTTTYDGFNIINTHELGKGNGDIEELPPQTGLEINNSINYNINVFSYILLIFQALIITFRKKIFN